MAEVGRQLVGGGVQAEPPAVDADLIPGMVVEGLPVIHHPGRYPAGDARRPGQGGEQDGVFVAVAPARVQGGQGVGQTEDRAFFEMGIDVSGQGPDPGQVIGPVGDEVGRELADPRVIDLYRGGGGEIGGSGSAGRRILQLRNRQRLEIDAEPAVGIALPAGVELKVDVVGKVQPVVHRLQPLEAGHAADDPGGDRRQQLRALLAAGEGLEFGLFEKDESGRRFLLEHIAVIIEPGVDPGP